VDPADQQLGGDAVPLVDRLHRQRPARHAGGVEPLDPQRAALLGVPVGVDLAHDQVGALADRRPVDVGAEAPLEGPVVGDVERAVVERGQRLRRAVGRVAARHDLERQVRGRAAATGHDVRRALGEVGVEVDGVRVVEPLASVLVGGVDEDRVVEVVVERHLDRRPDRAGQVVQALGELLLGDLERGVADQPLRLRHGLAERFQAHGFTFAITDSA
jgi:hypothetical protein